MSGARARIAIVVPAERAWPWHQAVIRTLRRSHSVDVFTDHTAPRYPMPLLVWLAIEERLFGGVPPQQPASRGGAWPPANRSGYSLIVNLAETALDFPDAPILAPRFDGSADSLALVAALLRGKTPYLAFDAAGEDTPLVASYPAIEDRTVLSRSLLFCFARLAALAERAVEHFLKGSRASLPAKPRSQAAPFNDMLLARAVAGMALGKVGALIVRGLRKRNHWSVALLRLDSQALPPALSGCELIALPDDGVRFYADPLLVSEGGREWLFVEEFDYRTGKGIISCTEAAFPLRTPRPILERPYHLSYPFVFEHEGSMFMLPETRGNRTVELYRATAAFPFEWTLHAVLLDDIDLSDATLVHHSDRWWMFGAIAHADGSTQDELAIFHSVRLAGPWLPHAQNPVKSDSRSARPAGRVIRDGDRLLRPAQDCEAGYGAGLVWLQVDELTPEVFSEHEIARTPAALVPGAEGLHTFNRDGRLAAIDMRRAVWRLPFGARKARRAAATARPAPSGRA